MAPRVIVVDDSMSVREQVATVLGAAGFEVVQALDGEDALPKIRATPPPALVISDVNMPRMNGIELLTAMKRDAALATIKFVMLTTEGQPTLIERAKQLGANGWIVKPFKPDLLVAAVKKLTG